MPLQTFRQICLPYLIKRHTDGSYSVLNREYSPIGSIFSHDREHYRADHGIDFKGLGPKSLEDLASSFDHDAGTYFLYNDGTLPDSSPAAWASYCERLRKLCRFQLNERGREEQRAGRAAGRSW